MKKSIAKKKLSDYKWLVYYEGSIIAFQTYEQAVEYCTVKQLNTSTIIPIVGEVN